MTDLQTPGFEWHVLRISFYPVLGPLFRQLLPPDSNPLLQSLSYPFPKTDKAWCLVALSPILTKLGEEQPIGLLGDCVSSTAPYTQ